MTYSDALQAFRSEGGGWSLLPFFRDGVADAIVTELDRRAASGATVLPGPENLFAALRATPLEQVRVVILGQDPYPTPGDAHGFAFSVRRSAKLPPSLRNIFKELAADIGGEPPCSGSLEAWAGQGVLLFNTCLSVEAKAAGGHRRLGWEALADQVVAAVTARGNEQDQRASTSGVVFILWGNDARRRAPLIDGARHGIIESAHPSPLSAYNGFLGSRPFSRANAWLVAHGREPVAWQLD